MRAVVWTDGLPTLTSDIVTVREVVPSDAVSLFEMLAEPGVAEHLAAPPPGPDAFGRFIAWAQQQRADGKSVCFGIVPCGLTAAVGIVQVRALEPSFFTAEWGFAIGEPFWGTGVFIDAANLVASFAFGTLHVDRLEARAVSHNARGQGALQKLGARPEAKLSRAFRKGARRETQLLWTLREDDWRQRRHERSRLSPHEAGERIARAIRSLPPSLQDGREHGQISIADYPFFLTDSGDDPGS